MVEWNGGMEWRNGIVECVLQGEKSLLMQFSMKVTVGVLFLIDNKVPEGSLIIQDLGGIEPEPFKNRCCGYLLSRLIRGKWGRGQESLASYPTSFSLLINLTQIESYNELIMFVWAMNLNKIVDSLPQQT